MADRDDKLPENVDGPFYVDSNCIDCDLCRENAPDKSPSSFSKGGGILYGFLRKISISFSAFDRKPAADSFLASFCACFVKTTRHITNQVPLCTSP